MCCEGLPTLSLDDPINDAGYDNLGLPNQGKSDLKCLQQEVQLYNFKSEDMVSKNEVALSIRFISSVLHVELLR